MQSDSEKEDERGRSSCSVVLLRVVEGPRHASLEEQRVDTRIDHASDVAEGVVERRSDVAHLLELLGDPRDVKGGLVCGDVDGGRVDGVLDVLGESGNGRVRSLGGEHTRLHGGVGSCESRISAVSHETGDGTRTHP